MPIEKFPAKRYVCMTIYSIDSTCYVILHFLSCMQILVPPFISETVTEINAKRVAWIFVGVWSLEGGSKSHGSVLQKPGGVLRNWKIPRNGKMLNYVFVILLWYYILAKMIFEIDIISYFNFWDLKLIEIMLEFVHH